MPGDQKGRDLFRLMETKEASQEETRSELSTGISWAEPGVKGQRKCVSQEGVSAGPTAWHNSL